jgi:uncharacterized protein with FMN-binding domain
MKRIGSYLVLPAIILTLLITGCGPRIYNDGTYKGISVADDRGFATAEVTVKGDKITEVKLVEFTGLAVEKDFSTYEWKASGEANQELPKRFVGKQDANVEVYSGATLSSKKYISAVSFALEKAKKKPDITTEYFDGAFMGKSAADEHGYGLSLVTIEKDKITGVRLMEVTEENQLRDYATYPHTPVIQAKEKLEKAFVEKNSPQVDAFTGATASSQKWIEAVANALSAARLK